MKSSENTKKKGINTRSLHYTNYDLKFNTLTPPLYQTVAYPFEDAQEAADIFSYQKAGHSYGRVDNPTCMMFENMVADLEGAEAGISTSTGMAAIFTVAAHLCETGDEIVSSNLVYGGTNQLFAVTLPRFGINTKFVERPNDIEAWEKSISPKTKFLYIETPSNPNLGVINIRAVADLAHAHNIPLVVDNTMATPILQRPLEFGADIVIHSATKYMSGNSSSLAGVIVGKQDLIIDIRQNHYRNIGPSASPFNAWMIMLSMETLPLRMIRHSENALQVARFLESHPEITKVHYPGLESHPQHALAKKQMPSGFSGMMAFEMKGGFDCAKATLDGVNMCKRVGHLGDSRTVLLHPASTTHQQLTEEERQASGINPSMIRLSVGMEAVEDIISDLDQSINKAKIMKVFSGIKNC